MKFTSSFEIKGWDVSEPDGPEELTDVSRATIRKSFSGELEGTSVGYGLLLQTPEQTGGYVVIEHVTAVIADGREGGFVIQHYGIRDASGGGPGMAMLFPVPGPAALRGLPELSPSIMATVKPRSNGT
jgi:hypothetical protein